MHSQKFHLYFLTLLSLLLGTSASQNTINLFSAIQSWDESSSQAILAVKPKVGQKFNNSVVRDNKDFLDDVKEDFEDIKDDAVDTGEDIGDDATDTGEDIKDDVTDTRDDIQD